MSTNTLARVFLRVAIFQGLRPLQLTEIARRADRIIFQPGDTIIDKDQPGETAYLIVTGQAVRVPSHDEPDQAEQILEGSLIAEMMMLVDSVHTSTIVAHSQVRALGINRSTLRSLMLEDRNIAEHFVAKITSRLSQLAIALRQIDKTLDSNQNANRQAADRTALSETNANASNHHSIAVH